MRPFVCLARALIVSAAVCTSARAAEKATPPAPPAEATPSQSAEPEEPKGTKAEQLAAAQKQLGVLRLRHDEQHPAVLKQRAKVIRLQKDVQSDEKANAPKDRAGQLEAAKRDLAKMRERYTDEHPAVKAQLRRISELEAAR